MTLNTVYKFKVNRILTLASRASTRFFEVIKGHNSGSNYRKSLKINRLLRLMTLNTVYKFKVNRILTLASRASTSNCGRTDGRGDDNIRPHFNVGV